MTSGDGGGGGVASDYSSNLLNDIIECFSINYNLETTKEKEKGKRLLIFLKNMVGRAA